MRGRYASFLRSPRLFNPVSNFPPTRNIASTPGRHGGIRRAMGRDSNGPTPHGDAHVHHHHHVHQCDDG